MPNHELGSVFSLSSSPDLVRPLARRESEDLIQLIMLEREPANREHFPLVKGKDLEAGVPGWAGHFAGLMAILAKRLQVLTPEQEYDPYVVLFLATICDRPGTAVLYAHSLAKATHDHGSVITLTILAANYIPWGVATEARLHELWDAQKGLKTKDDLPTDNYLDTREAWSWA